MDLDSQSLLVHSLLSFLSIIINHYKIKIIFGCKSKVAVYCKSGRRSRNAANILVKKGFKVYNLDKGILDWKELGKEISF